MKTAAIQIIDRGRGPQLSTTRITVLDIFYYLHRGYGYDVIQQAMPSLSLEEFDAVVDYVKTHREELVEKDRKAEEFIHKGIEAQQARGGIFAGPDETVSPEQRLARLKDILTKRIAGRNGERHSG
jgi:uncharacterized protein (DUF433 family)